MPLAEVPARSPSHPVNADSPAGIGEALHALSARVYPICRSLTGDGIRQTLDVLREHVAFELRELPTGTRAYDWTVPDEWNIRDAWVKNPRGEKVVDFHRHNLHVLGYSIPVHRRLSLAELRPHLHTLPDSPDWIPYRTSYFKRDWGFCLSHRELSTWEDGEYEVCIDASLQAGSMTFGEFFVRGREPDEVLILTHSCHPAMANDNAAGLAMITLLARAIASRQPRLSYRFVLAPGSVGATAWIAHNEETLRRLRHGIVLACVGGPGVVHYKKSRRGDAEVDRAVAFALRAAGAAHEVREFSPYGYAERQFCSPGFDLPVGCFMRTPHGEFPEYHTSADNLDYIRPEYLADSYARLLDLVEVLEGNRIWVNQNPKCEPRLGDRGLFSSVGGDIGKKDWEMALLWLLNLSDGKHSLLDIAERSRCRFALLVDAATALERAGLLKPRLDRPKFP